MASGKLARIVAKEGDRRDFRASHISNLQNLPSVPPASRKATRDSRLPWGCSMAEVLQIDGPAHWVSMDPETNLLDASPKSCTHGMAEPHTVKELAGGAWR